MRSELVIDRKVDLLTNPRLGEAKTLSVSLQDHLHNDRQNKLDNSLLVVNNSSGVVSDSDSGTLKSGRLGVSLNPCMLIDGRPLATTQVVGAKAEEGGKIDIHRMHSRIAATSWIDAGDITVPMSILFYLRRILLPCF